MTPEEYRELMIMRIDALHEVAMAATGWLAVITIALFAYSIFRISRGR